MKEFPTTNSERIMTKAEHYFQQCYTPSGCILKKKSQPYGAGLDKRISFIFLRVQFTPNAVSIINKTVFEFFQHVGFVISDNF